MKLLTDAEIMQLGRIRLGLDKIKAASERLNELARETGFEIRPLDLIPVALMGNDLCVLVTSHYRAEQAAKVAAFAAVGVDYAAIFSRGAA